MITRKDLRREISREVRRNEDLLTEITELKIELELARKQLSEYTGRQVKLTAEVLVDEDADLTDATYEVRASLLNSATRYIKFITKIVDDVPAGVTTRGAVGGTLTILATPDQ